MLTLEDVRVYYGAIQAVKGISLEVQDRELVALVGSNGAGKTTTLRTISGLFRPRTGRILYDGRDLTKVPPHEIVALGIAQSPEGRLIFGSLSVRDNLMLGAVRRRDRDRVAEDLERVFDLFPVLRERIGQAGGTLSGGEQQMLAIGRALMARPRLLLLDEPSLGLAPLLVRDIFRIVAQINRDHGTTILLVEQDAVTALSIAHYGYVLETGRVVVANQADALRNDEALRRSYLGY